MITNGTDFVYLSYIAKFIDINLINLLSVYLFLLYSIENRSIPSEISYISQFLDEIDA